MTSRRFWNMARVLSKPPWGLRRAARAACWEMEAGLVVLWPCTLSSSFVSAAGASDQPMRQPVIA